MMRGAIPDGFAYSVAAHIPSGYPFTDEDCDRAYCRTWGLLFRPRTTPETPTTLTPPPPERVPQPREQAGANALSYQPSRGIPR